MKPFTFRLQSVLRLRERDQQDALEAYGDAVRRRQERAHARDRARAHQEAFSRSLAEARSGSFRAADQQALALGWQAAAEEVARSEDHLRRARHTESEALQHFLNRKMETDRLLRLKEKQRLAHRAEAIRAEELEAEEIALSRFARRQEVTL